MVAGHGADIHIDSYPVRYHVGLAQTVSHVGREGRVGTGVQVSRHSRVGQGSQELVDSVRVKELLSEFFVQGHGVHLAPP